MFDLRNFKLGHLALLVPILVIGVAITLLVRASDDGQSANTATSIPEDSMAENAETENSDVDFGFVSEDANHIESSQELIARVVQFEEGYRSIYRSDTEAVRMARVVDVVAPGRIQYLRFDLPQHEVEDDRMKDTIAIVEDAEASIDGILASVARGEVQLSVVVTYLRVDNDGTEVRLGSVEKRSHWVLIDNQWMLIGADT